MSGRATKRTLHARIRINSPDTVRRLRMQKKIENKNTYSIVLSSSALPVVRYTLDLLHPDTSKSRVSYLDTNLLFLLHCCGIEENYIYIYIFIIFFLLALPQDIEVHGGQAIF